MLMAMQALPGSEGLRNGTLADWEAINRYLHILNDCIATGQAPDKALRNKDAWSKAVDKCITAALEFYPSAVQAAISRSDTALLSSIGQSLAYCICITYSCQNSRPAWLRLQERPHGLQRSVEALVSVTQRLPPSLLVNEISISVALTAAISQNMSVPASPPGSGLSEGLLVDLHCMHLKVSYLICLASMDAYTPVIVNSTCLPSPRHEGPLQ